MEGHKRCYVDIVRCFLCNLLSSDRLVLRLTWAGSGLSQSQIRDMTCNLNVALSAARQALLLRVLTGNSSAMRYYARPWKACRPIRRQVILSHVRISPCNTQALNARCAAYTVTQVVSYICLTHAKVNLASTLRKHGMRAVAELKAQRSATRSRSLTNVKMRSLLRIWPSTSSLIDRANRPFALLLGAISKYNSIK